MLPPRGSHLVPRGFPGVACTNRGQPASSLCGPCRTFLFPNLAKASFLFVVGMQRFLTILFSTKVFKFSKFPSSGSKLTLKCFCEVLINVVLAFLTTSSPDDCSMSASSKVHLRRSLFKRVLKRSFILKLCCMLPSFKVNRNRIPHD